MEHCYKSPLILAVLLFFYNIINIYTSLHCVQVEIPGATSLKVHFDSRCNTEESCDELTFSTNMDFPESNRRVFSGPRENWINFEVPGQYGWSSTSKLLSAAKLSRYIKL